MSNISGTGDNYAASGYAEDLRNEAIGGPLYAEEKRFPYESKRGPKLLLTINDEPVELREREWTPEERVIVQKMIDDMNARYPWVARASEQSSETRAA